MGRQRVERAQEHRHGLSGRRGNHWGKIKGEETFQIGWEKATPDIIFKVANEITMMVVDPTTGQKAKFSSKDTILEAYKSKNVIDGKVLYSNNNRLDTNNILKFY